MIPASVGLMYRRYRHEYGVPDGALAPIANALACADSPSRIGVISHTKYDQDLVVRLEWSSAKQETASRTRRTICPSLGKS